MTGVDADPGEIAAGICSREDCPVSDGGECALGHEDPLDCEYYELTEVETPDADEFAPTTRALPSGEALRPDQLEEVFGEHRASIVVPLGLVGAGKTTLMCLLFDEVRTRRATGWKFTRSRTVLGFARRSHDASFQSGRTIGKTPRTDLTASGLYLHLGMRRTTDNTVSSMVFVDLAGEHVRQFSDGAVIDVVVDSLKRADHVLIVVDGGDVAYPRTRQRAIYQARALIGRVEQQDLREHIACSVVITKGDLLVGVDTQSVFDEITLGTTFATAARLVTADRQSFVGEEEPGVLRGAGVDELLSQLSTLPVADPIQWPSVAPIEGSRFLKRAWGGL